MKVCFIHSEKSREIALANAFCAGVEFHGVQTEKIMKCADLETDANVVCMVGVKSLKLFNQARAQGKNVLFFDKGYFRHRGPSRVWEYWRIAVNDHHPTTYLSQARHKPDRWDIISARRGIRFPGWRKRGSTIIYAGSSAKYHAFASMVPPTEYAEYVISELRAITDKRIVYRPKPSWHEARPIPGVGYSQAPESLDSLLEDAWCLVTAGSNACFDSIMSGVPCIILGNAIARPISSDTLTDVLMPVYPSAEALSQWLANIAWCMFTENEMRSGLAWQVVQPQFRGQFIREDKLEAIAMSSMKAESVLRVERKARKRSRKQTRRKYVK